MIFKKGVQTLVCSLLAEQVLHSGMEFDCEAKSICKICLGSLNL